MRVYLGFTVAGNRSSVQAAKRLLSILQAMGHQVLTSHLVQGDAWGADRRVPPQEIFARDMKWLAESRARRLAWALRPAICLEQRKRKRFFSTSELWSKGSHF